jgi:hypothetical protein
MNPVSQPRLQPSSRQHQNGLSMIGWLATLVVIAPASTLTLKLLPHYIDFRTMQSVIEGLPKQEVLTASRPNLFETIEKRFQINNLREFKIRDIIEVERARDFTALTIDYERREHLFLNIDVVITFNQRFEFR